MTVFPPFQCSEKSLCDPSSAITFSLKQNTDGLFGTDDDSCWGVTLLCTGKCLFEASRAVNWKYCIRMASSSLTKQPYTQAYCSSTYSSTTKSSSICINFSAQDICNMWVMVGFHLFVSNNGIKLIPQFHASKPAPLTESGLMSQYNQFEVSWWLICQMILCSHCWPDGKFIPSIWHLSSIVFCVKESKPGKRCLKSRAH